MQGKGKRKQKKEKEKLDSGLKVFYNAFMVENEETKEKENENEKIKQEKTAMPTTTDRADRTYTKKEVIEGIAKAAMVIENKFPLKSKETAAAVIVMGEFCVSLGLDHEDLEEHVLNYGLPGLGLKS